MSDYLTQLFESPGFASWLAIVAVLISFLSYWWTRRSAKISEQALSVSKQAHQESAENNNRMFRLEIEQKRSELLREIAAEHELLKYCLLEANSYKADLDAAAEAVKVLLQSQQEYFVKNVQQMQDYKHQVEARYQAVRSAEYSEVSQLSKEMAVQIPRTNETRFVSHCGNKIVAEFREKFSKALDYVNGTTR